MSTTPAKPLLKIGKDESEAANRPVQKAAHPAIRRAVMEQIKFRIFGPSMRATLKQRALMYVSFRAMTSALIWGAPR